VNSLRFDLVTLMILFKAYGSASLVERPALTIGAAKGSSPTRELRDAKLLALPMQKSRCAGNENRCVKTVMCRKEVRTLSQSLTLRYDKVLFILDPTQQAKALAGKKVVVCDYPDGRLEIVHESFALPYRTFDKLRSIHRPAVVENKRLDDMLSIVAELQAGRELQRSKSGPRRTGQTDHMFGIPDGSQGNGYQKRGRKPGRRTTS
jgi:hypothetical protein